MPANHHISFDASRSYQESSIFPLQIFTALCLTSPFASAFPPAPHHTLHGIIRDQVGQIIPPGQGEIILLQGNKEILRRPITTRGIDENYRLSVNIDLQRFGTAAYQQTALKAGSLFSLAVDLNGTRFYPIHTQGSLSVGNGGDFVRLNLSLGEDSDGDGLPDIWEQWQLHRAGILPDEDGNWQLDLLSRNGDFDKDGQSDGFEYITGTFATDATETLELEVKNRTESLVQLEFYQITGKTYTIESSADFKNWDLIDFQVNTDTPSTLHKAPTSQVVQATATSNSNAKFFRLTVR